MNLNENITAHFREAGRQNTNALLDLVKEYVERKNVEDILIASTTGETGAKASNAFTRRNVVVVTQSFCFQEPGKTELREEYRKDLLAKGAKISQAPMP
jgi:hypothetical protein